MNEKRSISQKKMQILTKRKRRAGKLNEKLALGVLLLIICFFLKLNNQITGRGEIRKITLIHYLEKEK